MLGIYSIICLVVLLLIKLKRHSLLKDDTDQSVELDSTPRTYNVCYSAAVLHVISLVVILVGLLGCAWPFLFIEGIDRDIYLGGIFFFGLVPTFLIAFACYLTFKNANGYIKISTEEIEHKRRDHFVIKVSDIKKIDYIGAYVFRIQLKEKPKKPQQINLEGFYKKKELRSLMKQLRDHLAKLNGQNINLAYKANLRRLVFACSCLTDLYKIIIVLSLFYTSYCCIDYDFFRKDYTALYNAIGAEANQTENAWPHYVHAAVNYKKLNWDLQDIIDEGLSTSQLDLTDDQVDSLRKWFRDNKTSWASLKKAVSIDYCNPTYDTISLIDSANRNDFSNPSDPGYSKIKHIYSNVNACRLMGVLDLELFDLFQMQLTSSMHFVNGKNIIDYFAGYAMLSRSFGLPTAKDNIKLDDLQKTRALLKEYFPDGIPSLSIEGEILIECSTYNSMINITKIPVQTPLNPMFLLTGSISGAEAYARKNYTAALQKTRKGIVVESRKFSIMSFPMMRQALMIGLYWIDGTYKVSQRADTYLSAAYVLLDLEEYKLIKGSYPEEVIQLRDAGLTSKLPDDPDIDGKIIYRNDGQRAILYSVGKNAKDDGGYKDKKRSKDKRDDIIYWKRNLNDETSLKDNELN